MLYVQGTSNRYAERRSYEKLSVEAQNQIEGLRDIDWKKNQLLTLEKSTIPPKDGDLFVFSPKENIYFMGRVLSEKIAHKQQDVFINEKTVVCLF